MVFSIRDSYTPYSYHVISKMNSNGSSQALFVSQLYNNQWISGTIMKYIQAKDHTPLYEILIRMPFIFYMKI